MKTQNFSLKRTSAIAEAAPLSEQSFKRRKTDPSLLHLFQAVEAEWETLQKYHLKSFLLSPDQRNILPLVLSHLCDSDLLALSTTCREFYQSIILNENLWKNRTISRLQAIPPTAYDAMIKNIHQHLTGMLLDHSYFLQRCSSKKKIVEIDNNIEKIQRLFSIFSGPRAASLRHGFLCFDVEEKTVFSALSVASMSYRISFYMNFEGAVIPQALAIAIKKLTSAYLSWRQRPTKLRSVVLYKVTFFYRLHQADVMAFAPPSSIAGQAGEGWQWLQKEASQRRPLPWRLWRCKVSYPKIDPPYEPQISATWQDCANLQKDFDKEIWQTLERGFRVYSPSFTNSRLKRLVDRCHEARKRVMNTTSQVCFAANFDASASF